MSHSSSITRISWSSNSVIPLYPRYSTKVKVIVVYFPYSLFLILIHYIKSYSSSDFLKMYLNIFDPLDSALNSSLLILVNLTPLDLGRSYIIIISLSMIFLLLVLFESSSLPLCFLIPLFVLTFLLYALSLG